MSALRSAGKRSKGLAGASNDVPARDVGVGLVVEDLARSRRRALGSVVPWASAAGALLAIAAWCLLPGVGDDVAGLLHRPSAAAVPSAVATSSRPATTGPEVTPPAPRPGVAGPAASPSVAPGSPTVSESAPSAPVEALPPDLLAGPVSDDVLQQLLLQSTPGALSSSDPEVPTAVEAAWTVLVEDLQAGGWSSPHRQAVVLTASGRDSRDGQLPIVVDVHLMWSAVASSGDLDDRQLAVVRLQRGGGRWAGQILDIAGTTP